MFDKEGFCGQAKFVVPCEIEESSREYYDRFFREIDEDHDGDNANELITNVFWNLSPNEVMIKLVKSTESNNTEYDQPGCWGWYIEVCTVPWCDRELYWRAVDENFISDNIYQFMEVLNQLVDDDKRVKFGNTFTIFAKECQLNKFDKDF